MEKEKVANLSHLPREEPLYWKLSLSSKQKKNAQEKKKAGLSRIQGTQLNSVKKSP